MQIRPGDAVKVVVMGMTMPDAYEVLFVDHEKGKAVLRDREGHEMPFYLSQIKKKDEVPDAFDPGGDQQLMAPREF